MCPTARRSRPASPAFDDLRDECRTLAGKLGTTTKFVRADGIVGALRGTHAGKLSAHQALARAAGEPYDLSRIDLFDALFSALDREVFTAIANPAPPPALGR
jgi:hypothetical protein